MPHSKDGTFIYADAAGDPSKPCLVFVHGAHLSAIVWDDLFVHHKLLDLFYLVRYDVRGHGRSGKPEASEGYTTDLYAEDFLAVMKQFNVVKPLFIGWSLGFTIAADIMANLPSNTLFGLVSMAGLPYMEMLPDVASKTTLQYAGAMTNKENFRGAVEACMSVADLPFAKPEEVPFDIRCAWLGTILLPSVAVRGNYFSRKQDPTKLVEAAGQGLPLCVISGTADQVVYPKVALEELQSRFTDITLYEIEGAGHAVFYDAAEEVVDHVVSFARRIGFTVHVTDVWAFSLMAGLQVAFDTISER
ncbi:alpha/beta-hydrolase [Stereum hirsutum FP-91666 SS1]|uniref:alpha/beta-hydrolase n=1 Tax=Stereum hirsutum (strain FP-91666) TaxID=721885 RepID=UPI0004449AC6|nr:alpha/beta-hydrolase [Stereum hirsutum FP-91666 SS1]EIM83207.1 alpha/beta-hydrolase [Stereum hirsutum FP-91666 SS1]